MAKNFLILTFLLFFPGILFARDTQTIPKSDSSAPCKDWFEVDYDKFKDVTTIKPKNIRNGDLKLDGDVRLTFYISISYPGSVYDSSKPMTVTLLFNQLDVTQGKFGLNDMNATPLKFKDCHGLVMLVDGKKMDFGDLNYKFKTDYDDFTGFTYINETMSANIDLNTLISWIHSAKIEGEVCETSFEFKKNEFCILNTALNLTDSKILNPPSAISTPSKTGGQ
jgi:hypothetical protein